MKKSIKKLLSMFLIINICLVTTINTFAIDYQEPRIIKVGYTDYYNFINKDNDDKMYGYAVDYLQEISKHTNFRFEYVYMDWKSLIEALKNKKIDLICSAEKTAQRNEHFEFSQFPIITQQYILYTTTENKFYYNDFESFNNKTIGVLKNSVIDDRLNNYASKNNFEFTPKYFNTISEIQNSLQSNEIDFAAMTDTSPFQSFKNVGIYGVSQNYMMTYKDNDFMDDINKAVEEIKTEIYDFDWSLRQKYYSKVNTSTTFTKEENKYIENIEKINVGLISNNAPFTKENKDGKITGIYKDVFDLISDASGIEFNFKIISDSKTPSEILSKEDIDIFMGVSENYLSNYLKIKLSDPILKSQLLLIGKKDKTINLNESLTISIPEHSKEIGVLLKSKYPNLNILNCKTGFDSLSAIEERKADFTFMNTYAYNYQLKNPYFYNLEIKPSQTSSENLCIGLSQNSDPLLLSILNKIIEKIDQNDINKIINYNMNMPNEEITVFDSLYPMRFTIYTIVILIIIVIIMIYILFYFLNKNRKNIYALKTSELESQTKSEFFSKMSHEIRTPMNAIIGITELLLNEKSILENDIDNIKKVNSSAKYLLGIINDVLDMSKIENKKLVLNIQPVTKDELFEPICNIISPLAEAKNINFNCKTVGISHKYAYIDKMRLQQVIINLLSNAVKFTSQGGQVDFIIENIELNNNVVKDKIIIKDNGIGIDEKFLDKIFEPFEQESIFTVSNYGGTGLGLAIVKNLVDLMDGTIKVKSKKGEGTEFIIYLQFKVADEINVQNKKDKEYDFSGKNILLVEDHPLNTEIAKKILMLKGFNVTCAQNGKDGLKIFKQSSEYEYYAILMDIRMPVMNGIEATKKIRELKRKDAKTIPIIAMTANSINENHELIDFPLMSEYLSKPIDVNKLFETLSKYIKKEDK